MSQRDERRRLTRIRTAIAAVLTGADGAAIHARLENLSLIGLNAAADRAPAEQARYAVELSTDGDRVEARGTIVRSQGLTFALRFDELPFESYERLRAFLLRHANDPVVIAEELSDRLGFLGESA